MCYDMVEMAAPEPRPEPPTWACPAFPALIDHPLQPHWPIEVAAQVIVLRQLRALLATRDACWAGDDPRAVHRLRVACRRMRAAFESLGPVWRGKRFRQARRAVKQLASAFGRARDLDVEAASLAGRIERAPSAQEQALRWLWARGRRDRRVEQSRLRAALLQFEADDTPRRLVEWFSQHPLDLEGWAAVNQPMPPTARPADAAAEQTERTEGAHAA